MRATIARLKCMGFTGVILAYAKELIVTDEQADHTKRSKLGEETSSTADKEIALWTKSTLETVRLTKPGDFAAFKYGQSF